MSESLSITEIRKKLESKQGPSYWRGLEELADTPTFNEFLREEFPRQSIPYENSLDRRDFMKLLGASLALAGLTSCVRPVQPNEKIVPYVKAPEEMIPGRPLHFATAITQGGYALGVIAESHQGRPTKLEGNPDHPASLGATDVTTQATILSLYDPDRSQSILNAGGAKNWEDFTAALTTAVGNGDGLAILTETVTSPTLARQIQEALATYPAASWHQYDAMHSDSALEGARLAFGEAVTTRYDFSQAEVILSLGSDFLSEGPAKLRYTREFSRKRKVREASDHMNRLYVLESTPTNTGMMADHRFTVRPSQLAALASEIAHELGVKSAEGALPEGFDAHAVEVMVEDLKEHAGKSLVIAGDFESPYLHALAHSMNAALGNVGKTVFYHQPVEASPVNQLESLRSLVDGITSGKIKTLLILGGNPVYTAPVDLNFAAALEKVTSFHLSQYLDETSSLATWHIPQTHYLETWSDARAFDGTISIMQPLISPFYGGKSEHEVLAALLGSEASSYQIIQDTWKNSIDGDFDNFWRQSVYAGVIAGSASADKTVSLKSLAEAEATETDEYEILFRHDPSLQDGRWANNGWLQEVPKPLTKLTWDNVALLSPHTAEELGVSNGSHLKLTVGEQSLIAPVWILPGQAEKTITVNLGYGREKAGRVGSGLGFNANILRTSDHVWHGSVKVAKANGKTELASTQLHFAYEGTTERRHIIRHGTLAAFHEEPEHPHFVHPVEHPKSDLYPDFPYTSYAWGMVIDMNACTGCNACVTACQAENNIPIVGKKNVLVGREMHWIRIDTYYTDLDNPSYYVQPVNCMQCEKAPCEPVCPVGATVHDNEGLNVMVYNRCVGTRYCSNNCPYKVRRYNFLQYAELTSTMTQLSLAQNPDVTVRSRGVMEKCTYCTQRIQQAYIKAENEGRKIADGEVVTACQSACPAEAIVFGDLNTEGSVVSKTKKSKLNYALLEELNTVPRTTYLAKLTNPHPALAGETEAH
jgi:molybdopterin-containing oxidoreductase family iron-sulfur binding subunit